MSRPAWNRQNYRVPISSGRTTAIGSMTLESQQVLGINPQREKIVFHNPNVAADIYLYVCQALTLDGQPQPAIPGAGAICIYPGYMLTVLGNVGGAWNACSAVDGGALTILADPSTVPVSDFDGSLDFSNEDNSQYIPLLPGI